IGATAVRRPARGAARTPAAGPAAPTAGRRRGRPYPRFVLDPSGVLLELTCDEQAESPPEPTPGKQYRAGWRDGFDPAANRQFSTTARARFSRPARASRASRA
ncbi:MAG TPA: hypothetical protein PKC20_06720, partial [Burkholderiaceae bacterium]|nr:hypothetical protein [Burkholderiaceae bacterium]